MDSLLLTDADEDNTTFLPAQHHHWRLLGNVRGTHRTQGAKQMRDHLQEEAQQQLETTQKGDGVSCKVGKDASPRLSAH